jgi:hypothetical protein
MRDFAPRAAAARRRIADVDLTGTGSLPLAVPGPPRSARQSRTELAFTFKDVFV